MGYRFVDRSLLERALTHRSHSGETGSLSNERLEFLGDAVLSTCVVGRLHRIEPELAESVMSQARSLAVRAETLGHLGQRLGLGDHLRLGKGEDKIGGRQNARLAGDAVEAIIGAVYLDGGTDAACELVDRLLGDVVADAVTSLTASPANRN